MREIIPCNSLPPMREIIPCNSLPLRETIPCNSRCKAPPFLWRYTVKRLQTVREERHTEEHNAASDSLSRQSTWPTFTGELRLRDLLSFALILLGLRSFL